MTEEDKPRRARQPTDPVEHWCQHPGCTKWGGFGYDRGRGETDWWCWEHRPDREKVN
ncbi:MAG: hypothetical protein JWQ74_3551 [Marmoricola sp.]|nr:hypothetical protein [Marmoricola sp.]